MLCNFIGKDSFNGGSEESRQTKCERQAGVEFACFYSVDALPRDFEPLRKVGLAPLALGAEDAKPVLHWFLHNWMRRAIIAVTTKMSILKRPKGMSIE